MMDIVAAGEPGPIGWNRMEKAVDAPGATGVDGGVVTLKDEPPLPIIVTNGLPVRSRLALPAL